MKNFLKFFLLLYKSIMYFVFKPCEDCEKEWLSQNGNCFRLDIKYLLGMAINNTKFQNGH